MDDEYSKGTINPNTMAILTAWALFTALSFRREFSIDLFTVSSDTERIMDISGAVFPRAVHVIISVSRAVSILSGRGMQT